MIHYILLFCTPAVSCFQSISQKQYNLKSKHANAFMFSALTALISLIFFVVSSGLQLSFSLGIIPYALGFAIAYSIAWVGTILAVRYGLMAISTFIFSCYLIIPTIYGVIIGEKLTATLSVGIVLLFISMILTNLKFAQKEKFSFKWLIYVTLAFFGNGFCAIMQNQSKRILGEQYNHEFMITALGIAFLILLTCALFKGKHFLKELTSAVPFASLNGISSAITNLLMLTIIGNIPNVILYPTTGALSMIFTFILAVTVYKERFSVYQYIGYASGIISIVLLNI